MERWSIRNYASPYLAATRIEAHPADGHITIGTQSGDYEIEHALEAEAQDEMLGFLSGLTDAQSPLWAQLKSCNANEHFLPLVEELDRLGLIHDLIEFPKTGAAPDERLEQELSRIADFLRALFSSEHTGKLARQHADLLRGRGEEILAVYVFEHHPDLASCVDISATNGTCRDVLENENFYLLTLELQFRDWRLNCPAALAAALEALRRAIYFDSAERSLDTLLYRLSNSAISLDSVIYSLWCLGDLLSSSIRPGAGRQCVRGSEEFAPKSGIQFILEAESVGAKALVRLGPPEFLGRIQDSQISERLIQGCYIQEYHVNARFTGIISPMLSKRLTFPLIDRMVRYYDEEVGHESFELETCRSLGINSEKLRQSSPLPLHQAFVDVFAYLAASDPIAYMTSIFVTEGLPRALAPLVPLTQKALLNNPEFTAVAGHHEGLNDDLNHQLLARLLLKDVRLVDSYTQNRALDYLLYMIELNHRTWEHLYQYYSCPELPLHYSGPPYQVNDLS